MEFVTDDQLLSTYQFVTYVREGMLCVVCLLDVKQDLFGDCHTGQG